MAMECPFLTGERLYLRPLDEGDLDRCVRWINDPEVLVTLGRRLPMNRAREREWLAAHYKSDRELGLAIVLKEGDRHIGNCGLHGIDPHNRCAEFGVMLGEKNAWGHGYAPEAGQLLIGFGFRELGLHRIMLRVYAINERAQRAYDKLGFVEEGVLRESYFRSGRFHDTIVMSVLESEWNDRA
jgi:RimJ/RimL family protein N-acetyltransferase